MTISLAPSGTRTPVLGERAQRRAVHRAAARLDGVEHVLTPARLGRLRLEHAADRVERRDVQPFGREAREDPDSASFDFSIAPCMEPDLSMRNMTCTSSSATVSDDRRLHGRVGGGLRASRAAPRLAHVLRDVERALVGRRTRSPSPSARGSPRPSSRPSSSSVGRQDAQVAVGQRRQQRHHDRRREPDVRPAAGRRPPCTTGAARRSARRSPPRTGRRSAPASRAPGRRARPRGGRRRPASASSRAPRRTARCAGL